MFSYCWLCIFLSIPGLHNKFLIAYAFILLYWTKSNRICCFKLEDTYLSVFFLWEAHSLSKWQQNRSCLEQNNKPFLVFVFYRFALRRTFFLLWQFWILFGTKCNSNAEQKTRGRSVRRFRCFRRRSFGGYSWRSRNSRRDCYSFQLLYS